MEFHPIVSVVCCVLGKYSDFLFKEELKVPDREYGQIKKGRRCNEKK
jgi:hypothetical protein